MDEAVHEAFKAVRKDVADFRKDFREHVAEDLELRDQVKVWSGQLSTIKWLSGAILAAILAYGGKHW